MKVALFTKFPGYFIEDKIIPALEAIGFEVVVVDVPKNADGYDFKKRGIDLVLLMHEMVGHSKSIKLSKICKQQNVPVRALSRKKAEWNRLKLH